MDATTAIRTYNLSDLMVRAIISRRFHDVIVCNTNTERALVRRGLIERRSSEFTDAGRVVFAAVAHMTADAEGRFVLKPGAAVAQPEPKHQGFKPGDRVTGRDSQGTERTGTVIDGWDGVVDNICHSNYGRVYVGVAWDAVPGDMGANRMARPFTDTLRHV